MRTDKMLLKRTERLSHVMSHLVVLSDNKKICNFILNRAEHSENLFLRLESFFLARTMVAWFDEHSLTETKRMAYGGALMIKMLHLFKAMQNKINLTYDPGLRIIELLQPLISDDEALIDWFAHDEALFDQKEKDNHKKATFWAYQSRLALCGEWATLRERCERVLADPPKSGYPAKYLTDNQFFLALSQGDTAGMEAVLAEMVSPKVIRARNNDESGYTIDLISRNAFIHAKIAWRHGYQVKVDSPYIPTEWLPVAPIAFYECSLPFIEDLNVDTVAEFSKAWNMRVPSH